MFFFLSGINLLVLAQIKDTVSVTDLKEIKVVGYKAINDIGHFNEVHGPVIYAGKKMKL